ncbi:MAG: Wzz/FepE/Etk N-terminal domain-containing protein [Parvularculaceae bacterium]|nr:Wzz/FepE/Etk N-terminal domain-containing protein [Parvularculaceae bacterium]
MGLIELFAVLKFRKAIILWSILVGAAVAALLAIVLPTRYVSSALVQVDSVQRNAITGLVEPRVKVAEFLGQQAAVAASRTVALKVIEDLEAEGFLVLTDYEERWRKETGAELVAGNDLRLWAADQLLKDLSVTATDLGSTLQLSFSGDQPAQAARIANAFAAAYMDITLDQKQRRFAAKAAGFSDETKQLALNVASAQDELERFRDASGVLPIGAQKIEAADVEFASITQRLAEARADDTEAQSLLAQADATPRSALANFPLPQDALAALQAQARLAAVIASMGRIEDRYGTKYPDYAEAANERAALEASILQSVRDRAAYAGNRLAALEAEARSMKVALSAMQKTRERYDLLEDNVVASQEIYNLVTTRSLQEAMQSRVDTVDVFLLAGATPPAKPATPHPLLITLLGVIAGVLLGASTSVAVELLEGRIRSSAALRQTFRTGIVVEIAASAAKKRKRRTMKPRASLKAAA